MYTVQNAVEVREYSQMKVFEHLSMQDSYHFRKWNFSAELWNLFEEEGFKNIKLRMIKQNINMNGILE